MFRQLAADECAHAIGPYDVELRIRHLRRELLFYGVARVERGSNRDVIFSTLGGFLDRRVDDVHRAEGVPHLADIDELWRTQGQEVAALEVDTEILFSLHVKRRGAGNDQCG